MQRQNTHLEQLKELIWALLHILASRDRYVYTHQKAERLLKQIDENELRVTIVGEFSSGKSTFLNALIGKDILPHASSETTATLTYIHNVPAGHPNEDCILIQFVDDRRPDNRLATV